MGFSHIFFLHTNDRMDTLIYYSVYIYIDHLMCAKYTFLLHSLLVSDAGD